ncbi:fungal transcriptional regulatory protein [Pochonia chlamydosporia 170]|uniref:Fungal transcriptional regulatory protein n=1 Tax=Pochonia chlamydosporia 170 TaxID=1380566 RepID=A0A179F7M4_METCM|nr:fungal transcriptional regulatory protein [Pochonia chlamydosporia 170]OAQ61432.1 fungal transcriptional regulatory protein [Pochonia chlamydosporia 170]
MALSASVLGAQNNDSQLKLKGLQTYCSATVDMLNAVQHQKHSRSDGVLAAVRLLEFYEVLFGFGAKLNSANSNLASWWRHNDGQLALILHRGPYSFQHGPAHTLFVDARYNTALSHLTRRKRCPLDDSDWKTIPWIYCKKSIKDRLVDILVHLPGLMQDMDILQELTLIAPAGEWKKKVLKSCLGLKEALRRWETEIGQELERFDYTVSTTPLKPPSTDREVSLLHLSTLYWAISLAVDTSLGTLLVQNARSGGVEGDCEDDSETESTSSMATSGKGDSSSRRQLKDQDDRRTLLRTYAYKIAHAIPLLFEPESGAFGCNVALFPLLSAWRFLSMTEPVDKPSPEHQIILKLSEKQFQGTSVGRFSASLKRDVWNHKQSGHAAKKD